MGVAENLGWTPSVNTEAIDGEPSRELRMNNHWPNEKIVILHCE